MISLDDLRFFALLAKSSSLVEVARSLDVTAPAVTQRLQQLEARVGVRLVNRSTRSLSLTAEGSLLVERSQYIITEIDDITEAVPVVNQIRIYWWCSPPRTGRQRMVPASWTARETGASFSKDKCVLISL
jgi:DNA-binding transcriptional LysR family regulator